MLPFKKIVLPLEEVKSVAADYISGSVNIAHIPKSTFFIISSLYNKCLLYFVSGKHIFNMHK